MSEGDRASVCEETYRRSFGGSVYIYKGCRARVFTRAGCGVTEAAVKTHMFSYVPRTSRRLSYFIVQLEVSDHVKIETRLINIQCRCDAHCSYIN